MCETFEPASQAVHEIGDSSVVYPDGTYTNGFETSPNGFVYEKNFFTLGTNTIYLGATVNWGRYFSPSVNSGKSHLWFPPGISVGLAYLRVRSMGGGDWTITPVDRNKTAKGIATDVLGGDIPVESAFICGQDFFGGLEFEGSSSEPAIFEVCIPQDPGGCFAVTEQ